MRFSSRPRGGLAGLAGLVGLLSLLGLGLPAAADDPICGNATAGVPPTRMEFDIVFPRNETYNQTDVLPIVVALQNYTALPALGDLHVGWYIMPYGRDGSVPGGLWFDNGEFALLDNGDDDHDHDDGAAAPLTLVDYTNVTQWVPRIVYGDRYMLQVYLQWTNLSLDTEAVIQNFRTSGHLMFSILTDEVAHFHPEVPAVFPDFAGAAGAVAADCQVLGTVWTIAPSTDPAATNASDGTPCPYVVHMGGDDLGGTPSASHTSTTTTHVPLSTAKPNAAVAAFRPSQPLGPAAAAVAAAGAAVGYGFLHA
ncbi:hypothetical protein SPI_03701 [Niveomyces insectorum RCEF 264]|uniref:DUF7136 domain-containing protein n=1 Tax=Niveomyces insectorum RCEF 264 TaxID=1081102 RepID=A0A167WAG0_9HYPO|nr:hypothetical protein SPI_03701 [Niveomyces insectorum RCEF 264]